MSTLSRMISLLVLLIYCCPANSVALAGGDVGSGGDLIRPAYMEFAKDIISSLENRSYKGVVEKFSLDPKRLRAVITFDKIKLVSHELYDEKGSLVYALSKRDLTQLNHGHWHRIFKIGQDSRGRGFRFLIFHETLLAAGYDDKGYRISNEWLKVSRQQNASPVLDPKRCPVPDVSEPYLTLGGFFSNWSLTPAQIDEKFNVVYNSPARMIARAYYDPRKGSYILPFYNLKTRFDARGWPISYYYKEVPMILPREFILRVTKHLQKIIASGFGKHLIFSDLGVGFFYIPKDVWQSEYDSIPLSIPESDVPFAPRAMEKILRDSRMKILYRSAMQMMTLDENNKVLDDQYIQSRYYTRNIMADSSFDSPLVLLQDPRGEFNTVWDYPNYKHFFHFSVSANKDGCFPIEINGQIQYFDISFHDVDNTNRREYGIER